MTDVLTHPGPEWVVAEMPAGYQNRLTEIQRLVADLQQMGRFARLLWQVGPELGESLRDAFTALRYEAEAVPVGPTTLVTVRVDGGLGCFCSRRRPRRRCRRRARKSPRCSSCCRKWRKTRIASSW